MLTQDLVFKAYSKVKNPKVGSFLRAPEDLEGLRKIWYLIFQNAQRRRHRKINCYYLGPRSKNCNVTDFYWIYCNVFCFRIAGPNISCLSDYAIAKGQLISKRFFGVINFLQKTNELIQLYYNETCFSSFFGGNRRPLKNISKLTDLQ